MRDLRYSISITSKDRNEILADTVRQLARIAADATELVLVDDGSRIPVDPATFGPLPFPVRLIRHDVSKGLIPSRNEIVRECRTPYMLSCDDDSFPFEGDLAEAVAFLAERPELFAVSFPYFEGAARKPINPSANPSEPYRVRMFIACAYLFRADYFLTLGGFNDWFGRQNEERDLSYRALMHGWDILHYPRIKVFHHYTSVARDLDKQDFNTMRNEMALELKRIPLPAAFLKLFRNGFLALWWSVSQRRSCFVRGYLAGITFRGPTVGRLSWEKYREFRDRPWA